MYLMYGRQELFVSMFHVNWMARVKQNVYKDIYERQRHRPVFTYVRSDQSLCSSLPIEVSMTHLKDKKRLHDYIDR